MDHINFSSEPRQSWKTTDSGSSINTRKEEEFSLLGEKKDNSLLYKCDTAEMTGSFSQFEACVPDVLSVTCERTMLEHTSCEISHGSSQCLAQQVTVSECQSLVDSVGLRSMCVSTFRLQATRSAVANLGTLRLAHAL